MHSCREGKGGGWRVLLPESNTSGSCHHTQLKSASLGTLPLLYRHAEEMPKSSLSAEVRGPEIGLEILVLVKVDINTGESLLWLRCLA